VSYRLQPMPIPFLGWCWCPFCHSTVQLKGTEAEQQFAATFGPDLECPYCMRQEAR
jgi:hypothetical protein